MSHSASHCDEILFPLYIERQNLPAHKNMPEEKSAPHYKSPAQPSDIPYHKILPETKM